MKRLLASLVVLAAASPAGAVTEISNCTDITLEGTAVITADLDCSADPLLIRFEPFGILELQGHTVMSVSVLCQHPGQYSAANCVVEGPGTVSGGDLGSSGKIVVRDVALNNGRISGGIVTVERTTITGPDDDFGIDCGIVVDPNYQGSLRIIDSTVTGAKCGVFSQGNTSIRGSRFLSNTAYGVRVRYGGFSARLKMTSSEVSNNGTYGVSSSRIAIKDSTIDDNGDLGVGVEYQDPLEFGATLSMKGSRIRGNRIGVGDTEQRTTSISGCEITGNRRFGIDAYAKNVKVRDSVVTGNGVDPECGSTMYCADFSSWHEPSKDADTTCDTSLKWDRGWTGENWGICALD